MADLTGRVGVISANRTLVYLKGGASLAQARFSPQNEVGFSATTGYGWTNQNRTGTVLGIGFEYAISPTTTLGVEYDYRDYGKKSTNFTPVLPVNSYNPAFSADTSLNVGTLAVRFNYKF